MRLTHCRAFEYAARAIHTQLTPSLKSQLPEIDLHRRISRRALIDAGFFASYRGSSGNCAAPAGTRIPFSFRLVQIWMALDASTGTSKAPALILTVSDGSALSCHRREPQSAQ